MVPAAASGPPAPATARAAAASARARACQHVRRRQQLGQHGAGPEDGPADVRLEGQPVDRRPQPLWTQESGFNAKAQNPTSTAYGIAQFLDSTWGPYGPKTSNPGLQIKYGLEYIHDRYGNPLAAEAHERGTTGTRAAPRTRCPAWPWWASAGPSWCGCPAASRSPTPARRRTSSRGRPPRPPRSRGTPAPPAS